MGFMHIPRISKSLVGIRRQLRPLCGSRLGVTTTHECAQRAQARSYDDDDKGESVYVACDVRWRRKGYGTNERETWVIRLTSACNLLKSTRSSNCNGKCNRACDGCGDGGSAEHIKVCVGFSRCRCGRANVCGFLEIKAQIKLE